MGVTYFKGKDKLFGGRESKIHKSSYGSLDLAEIPEWGARQQYTVGITVWVDVTTTIATAPSLTVRYVYMCITQHYADEFFSDTNWQLISGANNTITWAGSGETIELFPEYNVGDNTDYFNWEYAAGASAYLEIAASGTGGALDPQLRMWNWPIGATGTLVVKNGTTPGVPFINNTYDTPLFKTGLHPVGGPYVPGLTGSFDKLTVIAAFDGADQYYWDYGYRYRPY